MSSQNIISECVGDCLVDIYLWGGWWAMLVVDDIHCIWTSDKLQERCCWNFKQIIVGNDNNSPDLRISGGLV